MKDNSDDLLAIPDFLRRTMDEATRARPVHTSRRRVRWIMPKPTPPKTRKRRGTSAALRRLGWRPCDIKRMTREQAEQTVALRRSP